ncbi:putative arabinose efflux permease, MFS family [Streptoalloteichus tenebrarius]|uniref:Arabinose efflux permease, MFS family n=1 Tax=Streptoalloteichus tenebrarius (strain ATCC 17920 / DSM 40477 / JCM 4838 / CBS 697.72 / NBRC 16177 / NCIMB 11028 / NRRL B-12390 / A12253. 1 / ISP 5477) TaxID=1933 RepID=A0ABT1HN16_STRSD|nr:MFS transporter [Streptoalloteichus tenebrarius]MCP2256888.1 putative arabinose efflux permease, MFS family [Streptoalloteichus tenebrarius]BFF00205.1 MFS transporter [Streptoalloteichus tenebrarius]
MTATGVTGTTGTLARVVGAGVVGTTVEFYDFFLYGAAAATVFGPVFFPHSDGLLGVLLALVTYAVGFAARPLGGLVFGHFGDRIGRKRLLVVSLLMMGGASVLIGLLPGYHQIGVAAPVLLTVLRLIQGFALGGEFGGAVLLVAEHGPAGRRGFWTAWPQAGGPLGNLLATAALAATGSVMSEAEYAQWGWRVPFLASVLLVLVGLWVRLQVTESPLFAATLTKERPPRAPLVQALRTHPRALFSVFAARVGENATFYVFTIFLLVYAGSVGLPKHVATGAVTIGSVVQIGAMLLGGALSDRWGRRPVSVAAATGAAAWTAAFFPLVGSGQYGLVLLAVGVGLLLHGLLTGAQSAFYAELFDTTVRYSGVSLGYQAATLLAGAAAPLVGTELLRTTHSPVPIALLLAGCLALTVLGMLLAPETSRRDLA